MTNPVLELVLEVARKVYPEGQPIWHEWVIHRNNVVKLVTGVDGEQVAIGEESPYEPHLNTERGKAQLMDLVFMLAEKGEIELVGDKEARNKIAIFTTPPTKSGNVLILDAEDSDLSIAILKLYVEVM